MELPDGITGVPLSQQPPPDDATKEVTECDSDVTKGTTEGDSYGTKATAVHDTDATELKKCTEDDPEVADTIKEAETQKKSIEVDRGIHLAKRKDNPDTTEETRKIKRRITVFFDDEDGKTHQFEEITYEPKPNPSDIVVEHDPDAEEPSQYDTNDPDVTEETTKDDKDTTNKSTKSNLPSSEDTVEQPIATSDQAEEQDTAASKDTAKHDTAPPSTGSS